MLIFDGEVFREDVVCAADNEAVDELCKLLEASITLFPVFFRAVSVAATENRKFVFFAKVETRPEEVRVREVEEREVFRKVVLDGGSGEDDAAVDVKGIKRGEGLRFAVFETVAFVAKEEADGDSSEFAGVQAEGLVGYDEDRADNTATAGDRPLF